MTALIRQGNRKCDSACYDARAPKCSCICGGKNHGVGEDKAIDNNRRLFGMKALSRYEIVSDVAGEPLIIRDVGHMDHKSITNDAANVVADLVSNEYLPAGRRLYYYDSQGQLDELIVKDGEFAGFARGPRKGAA